MQQVDDALLNKLNRYFQERKKKYFFYCCCCGKQTIPLLSHHLGEEDKI